MSSSDWNADVISAGMPAVETQSLCFVVICKKSGGLSLPNPTTNKRTPAAPRAAAEVTIGWSNSDGLPLKIAVSTIPITATTAITATAITTHARSRDLTDWDRRRAALLRGGAAAGTDEALGGAGIVRSGILTGSFRRVTGFWLLWVGWSFKELELSPEEE